MQTELCRKDDITEYNTTLKSDNRLFWGITLHVFNMCVHVSALYVIACLHNTVLHTTVNLFALELNHFDLCLTWSSVPAHATLIQINLCTFPHEVTTPTTVYHV